MNPFRKRREVSSPPSPGEVGVSHSDAELVRAARRGDKRAFVEIVARHQATVCGIALGVVGDFAASEDAAQEAFLTAWRKIHELREPEKLRGWLGQIARNASLGHLRRQRGHDVLDENLLLQDEAPGPDETAAHAEEAALVRDSLAKLPETYRLPMILFYREGHSVRAVAESLEISEDAVKQRLARGRDMLRERMTGLIETVLTRTKPSPIFTMTIAVAIGALAAPAAIASGVFAAAATATSAGSSTSLLTAMSTSKTFLATTAVVAVICIPVGYHASSTQSSTLRVNAVLDANRSQTNTTAKASSALESSALFLEWRQLHEIHGTNSQAMPALYQAINDFKDPFRRRAFRAALISEWVQVDPASGLAFFMEKDRDRAQRKQFFEEWLARDPRAAVESLLAQNQWEETARNSLEEIARRVPEKIAEIAARLPKSDSYWDTSVRDAFAILAEGNLDQARMSAERMSGSNQQQALAGIAKAWAKKDIAAATEWARALPKEIDRDEVVRAALLGKAAVDPVAALDLIRSVPPGGKDGYFATTTGARVLIEASKADFDTTVAWIAAHPGKLGHDEMVGVSQPVTERLNADPASFLKRLGDEGALAAMMPAIGSALLNDASGQRAAIWEWLKTQPDSPALVSLRSQVLSTSGYQDPDLALRLAKDVSDAEETQNLARSLINGGQSLQRFDKLYQQAPEGFREPLLKAAFESLRGDTMQEPEMWIARVDQLPADQKAHGIETIARAWADRLPEDAIRWVAALPAGEARSGASEAIASQWAARDAEGAVQWVSQMPAGLERDRTASGLVMTLAEKAPLAAWEWAQSIVDPFQRNRAAVHTVKMVAIKDPSTAAQWIDSGPFAPELKTKLHAELPTKRKGSAQP